MAHPTKVANSKVSYNTHEEHELSMEPAQAELICTQWNQCHKPIDTLRLTAIHFYESLGMVCNAIRVFLNRKINV
jgi:hypothetical protein